MYSECVFHVQDDEFRDFIVDDEPGAGGGAALRRPRARKGAGLSNVSNAALQVLQLLNARCQQPALRCYFCS